MEAYRTKTDCNDEYYDWGAPPSPKEVEDLGCLLRDFLIDTSRMPKTFVSRAKMDQYRKAMLSRAFD